QRAYISFVTVRTKFYSCTDIAIASRRCDRPATRQAERITPAFPPAFWRLQVSISHKAASFHWADPLLLDQQITQEERMVRESAAAYCQERLAPRVLEAFRNEKTDPGIFREMGELGLLGPTIPEAYGGAGLNYVCYGLVAREVERVDS